ncbi:hypothetical protein BV20DRAFT_631259 [Pilatotrama ljubarskyi]|nr:hypothetical protein BV20DRAFT_631259 [Pilatotrama ljubarskyi]
MSFCVCKRKRTSVVNDVRTCEYVHIMHLRYPHSPTRWSNLHPPVTDVLSAHCAPVSVCRAYLRTHSLPTGSRVMSTRSARSPSQRAKQERPSLPPRLPPASRILAAYEVLPRTFV